ncbi:hypothetical protein [Kamptonema formosum]|uniref:hypothetical protein n=1 Tax=Kamptonema formosum TaxID=331992 RepID=UPI00034D6184|nr:hypothetical protein [Oscillatoria sp. PCC 10802]
MNFQEFVLYLGQNPYKFLAAQENADEVMEEAGLSEEDREILTSGDLKRIAEAIRGSETAQGTPLLG